MTYNPDANAHDAFDDAMTDEPPRFFGRCTIEAYTAYFYKNSDGKWKSEPHNPELHGDEAEIAKAESGFLTTQVDITVTPIDPTRKTISRSMGAKNRKKPEFQRVVRPSIEALEPRIAEVAGLQVGQFNILKAISGLWVGGEFVPRPDDPQWTTLRFTDVYANQQECAEAAATYYNREIEAEVEAPTEDNSDAAKLVPFLPPLWEQAGHDVNKMAELLAQNPLLSMYFTMDSPEVQTIVNESIPY